MTELREQLKQAREISWQTFGKRITFYLPGMFSYDGISGKYPAVSITGRNCALQCEHCQGNLLHSMVQATTPSLLLEECRRLADKGNHGVLISGGCDEQGRLPWNTFCAAIEKIKSTTDLYISVHSGLIDYPNALRLKEAGVDQTLIDVIGDDDTVRNIYHVTFGVSRIISSLEALQKAQLPVVPHLVCGLNCGKIKGERNAIEIIAHFDIKQVVIVSLMRIPGTPLWGTDPPKAEEIAEIIVETRFHLPHACISLGCARERGNTEIERLAIDAGVNRMAVPSDEAMQWAIDSGLEVNYQKTCCSVSRNVFTEKW